MLFISLLGAAVSVCLLIFAKTFYTLRRIRHTAVSDIMRTVGVPGEQAFEARTIIIVSYSDSRFAAIDELLAAPATAKEYIVVLDGPDWLLQLKIKKWSKHRVIPLSSFAWKVDSSLVLLTHGRSVVKISYVPEFIRSNLAA